jgi:hypothetical protein
MICHLGNNKIKFATETRLNKILVGVVEWVGDIDHFTELKEVWVRGDPPKMVLMASICSYGIRTWAHVGG